MADNANPTSKEKAIFYLKSLIELIENDRVAAEKIAGLSTDEVIQLAEAEAERAARGADDLANRN